MSKLSVDDASILYEGLYLSVVNSDYASFLEKDKGFEPIRNISPNDKEAQVAAYENAIKAICDSLPNEKLDQITKMHPELEQILKDFEMEEEIGL